MSDKTINRNKASKVAVVTTVITATVGGVFSAGSVFSNSTITEEQVTQAQTRWGDAIVAIGESFSNKGDYRGLAADVVATLYAYEEGSVLFKPTKAAEAQFRSDEQQALSYFVTGGVAEDHGFAIQPWSNVRFENHGVIINADSAIAMGNYFFADASSGKEVKVEYTFGYQRADNGELLINLHHSSFPYLPE